MARGLSQLGELGVDLSLVQSNMVFVDLPNLDPLAISKRLYELGIKVIPSKTIRLVTHLDVSKKDIQKVIESFKTAIQQRGLEQIQATTEVAGPRY